MKIYTDGACQDNIRLKGRGAWAFYVKDTHQYLSGVGFETTSNRMEIQAFIEVFKKFSRGTIYTDSMYCIYAFKNANKWLKKTKTPNLDLIKEFCRYDRSKFSVEWVRGHSGVLGNEIANSLACEALNAPKGVEYQKNSWELDPLIKKIDLVDDLFNFELKIEEKTYKKQSLF